MHMEVLNKWTWKRKDTEDTFFCQDNFLKTYILATKLLFNKKA